MIARLTYLTLMERFQEQDKERQRAALVDALKSRTAAASASSSKPTNDEPSEPDAA